MAVKEYGLNIVAVGDEHKIRDCATREKISLENIEIRHAPDVIQVEDDPTQINKQFKNSSMAVGLQLLADGEGEAFVSAGSTGALVVGSSLIVKRIRGIKRAAIGTVIPTMNGRYLLILSLIHI